jgi:hypothetical protein
MKRNFEQFVLAGLLLAAAATSGRATIYGTMSNFDVFNDTPYDAYGAELELEGVHATEVYNTFPSHFDHRTVTEYNNGITFGTRVDFSGYNFSPAGYLEPTVGTTTNGHACVQTAGCEHFGFSLSSQPTATHYYWTDQTGQRIGNLPMDVPTPSWSYVQPAGNVAPELHAEVERQNPDAVWMKVFKTELNRPVKLKELMSGNPIVPEDVSETETEWELLERGVLADAKDRIRNDAQKAIIRRYEYYKYTGPYDAEHEPLSAFDSNIMVEPPAGELGNFISANMVAANLVPLPVIEGDYNDDGVVDAGDYLAWRKHLGSEVEVEVDGDHSGRVDDGDLGVWRQHYGGGQAGAGALVSGGAVPEPATLVLLLTALAVASIRRAHRAK